MTITELLKKWLVDNCDVKADASDDEFKKSAAEAMVEGKLTAEKYAELTRDPKEDEANEFSTKLDGIADGIGKLIEVMSSKKEGKKEEKEVEEEKIETPPEVKVEKMETDKMVGSMGGTPIDPDGKDFNIRVKEAAEMYSTTKKALVQPELTAKGGLNPLRGQSVKNLGRTLMEPSEQDKALAGAWAKFVISTWKNSDNPHLGFESLPQHDKELMHYLCNEGEWDLNRDDKQKVRKGYPGGVKQLVDDGGASGALEAAPIVFDDQIIETPLLFGELFPLVNVVPIDRGRRIEGVEVGQVTGEWGGVDDTAITLFNTTGYVSDFNTSIFRWQGSIHVGLDFLSDTPLDFGQIITRQYGNELLRQLDVVIAVGNGTTQPEGVMNSGATAVAFGGVAATLAAYETLRFGVAKPEHTAPGMKQTAVFCGTETSYSRAKAIPVGAADARRLGGMDYDSYTWMQRPFKINESLGNDEIFYAILGRYRMYRRRGLTIRSSTEGETLIRGNELLIAVTGRFGGRMERAAAASLTTTAQA